MKKWDSHFSFITHLIPIVFILFISFPLWVFLWKVQSLSFPESGKVFFMFSSTLLQALLSVLLSWLMAMPATFWLLKNTHHRFYSLLEWILLLPVLLPSIVVASGLMNVLGIFNQSVFGFHAVVFGHAVTYSGAMAVVLARLVAVKCHGWCEWAWVHHIGTYRLFFTLCRSVIKKDIQLISLTVFCFCFTSFSIPVLMGSHQWSTLEVFIYEYLKNPQQWPMALALLLIELVFIFILSLFISQSFSSLKRLKSVPYLGSQKGLLIGILPVGLVLMGLAEGLWYLPEIFTLDLITSYILSTLFLSMGVGMGTLLLLTALSLLSSYRYLRVFLIGYGTPSVMLTGWAFLIFFDEKVYFSWILGLTILFLPALYRWAGESFLSSLHRQIQVAQTLGVSLWHTFKKIIWPQCVKPFCFLSAVAGFWASGEFAFTMVTSSGEFHLAILAQQLMSQYRFEQGLAVVWLLLLIGSLSFIFFGLLSYLLRFDTPD